MITRLNSKDFLNIIEFFDRIPDKAEDMYITIDKKRILLKNNSYLIKKILKYQEVYSPDISISLTAEGDLCI